MVKVTDDPPCQFGKGRKRHRTNQQLSSRYPNNTVSGHEYVEEQCTLPGSKNSSSQQIPAWSDLEQSILGRKMGSRPGRSRRQWSVPVQSFDFDALRELKNPYLL